MRHTRYLLKIIASNEWASRVEFLQTSFPEASAMVFHVGWERFWLCLFAGRTLRDQNNEVSRFLKPQCANSKFTLRTNCSISGLNSLVCGSDSWFWLMVLTQFNFSEVPHGIVFQQLAGVQNIPISSGWASQTVLWEVFFTLLGAWYCTDFLPAGFIWIFNLD